MLTINFQYKMPRLCQNASHTVLHYLHDANKEYPTFIAQITPLISQILKGIWKMQALTHQLKEQHLTFSIMEWLHSGLLTHP